MIKLEYAAVHVFIEDFLFFIAIFEFLTVIFRVGRAATFSRVLSQLFHHLAGLYQEAEERRLKH